jgi:hypothetical protein
MFVVHLAQRCRATPELDSVLLHDAHFKSVFELVILDGLFKLALEDERKRNCEAWGDGSVRTPINEY